jgi:hypothetical protein
VARLNRWAVAECLYSSEGDVTRTYPRLQHITVRKLLDGKKPQTPRTVLPYIAAEKLAVEDKTEALF